MQDLRPANGARQRCYLCGAENPDCTLYPSGHRCCAEHPWCEECGVAHLRLPCPEQLGRINNLQAAQAAATRVLGELHALGIQLPRVPLRLVPSLPEPDLGNCLTSTWFGSGAGRTASIQIKAGLGPTRFGRTVAHEHTHALIHLHGMAPVDPALAEGVCEMVAMVWLTSRGPAQEILAQIWHNPDPVYGVQMRRAVTVARRVGVGVALKSVLTTGGLP